VCLCVAVRVFVRWCVVVCGFVCVVFSLFFLCFVGSCVFVGVCVCLCVLCGACVIVCFSVLGRVRGV